MTYFLTAPADRHFIEGLFGGPGRGLRSRMEVMTYEQAYAAPDRPGTYVFGGANHLLPAERSRAAEIWLRLSRLGSEARLLNNPLAALDRYQLLRALHENGSNAFRARRLLEPEPALRFPVFIRHARRHDGPLTELLGNEVELASASDMLQAFEDPDDLLTVEFCDTSDDEGVFRKYGVFVIGDHVIPRYTFCSRDWVVKIATLIDDRKVQEEREFMETNPHEDWVRDVFRMAGIDYGRIDYALLAGRPQAWEINTNPSVWHRDDRVDYHERAAQRIVGAFEELDRVVAQ